MWLYVSVWLFWYIKIYICLYYMQLPAPGVQERMHKRVAFCWSSCGRADGGVAAWCTWGERCEAHQSQVGEAIRTVPHCRPSFVANGSRWHYCWGSPWGVALEELPASKAVEPGKADSGLCVQPHCLDVASPTKCSHPWIQFLQLWQHKHSFPYAQCWAVFEGKQSPLHLCGWLHVWNQSPVLGAWGNRSLWTSQTCK